MYSILKQLSFREQPPLISVHAGQVTLTSTYAPDINTLIFATTLVRYRYKYTANVECNVTYYYYCPGRLVK